MKMKRFVAANMQKALKQIREELGPEAVILSTKKLASGTEVVGALNYDEDEQEQWFADQQQASVHADDVAKDDVCLLEQNEYSKADSKRQRARKQLKQVQQATSNDSKRARFTSADSPKTQHGAGAERSDTRLEIASLKQELLALRAAVEYQADNAGKEQRNIAALSQPLSAQGADSERQFGQVNAPVSPRAAAGIRAKVRSLGVLPELEEQLLAQASSCANSSAFWRTVLTNLTRGLTTEDEEIIDKEGCFALLGPTGAGKTSTIAKLAARFVLKYGPQKIALVTTDRFRVAASQHLQSFGRLLNVPVLLVDDSQTLDDVLDRLSDKRLVLIDTAGLNPLDANWQIQSRDLQVERHQLCNYLVISTVTQSQVMKALCHHYRPLNLAGCILTKVDEAYSLGEAISTAILQQLPIAYFTDGQHIPQHLHHAQAHQLIHRAVDLADENNKEVVDSNPLTA